MMKGSKAKVVHHQKVLPDYEMRRIERLKQNVDFMAAKGHGSLASKIFQVHARIHIANVREEDMFSDEDEDYIAEEEGDVDMDEISNTVGSFTGGSKEIIMKVPKQPKQSMVEYVKQHSQNQELQHFGRPLTKSVSMDEYHKQTLQEHACLRTKQQLHERVLGKMHEKENKFQQPVRTQVLQPQKKHQLKQFCSRGRLSAFRDLRKKQRANMIRDKDALIRSDNDLAYESQLNNTDTNQGPESELQPREIERRTMDDGEGREFELQPMTEIPTEAPKNKKKRGPTKMAKVHARTLEERQVIVLNKFGQPIGPTKEVVGEFTRFLGTIARDSELAPLNYVRWPKQLDPQNDKIWDYILQKYMVPEEGRKWAIGKISCGWRIYKSRVKKLHYYAHETDEVRKDSRPSTISEPQFTQLINYWNCPSIEEESKKDRNNRQILDDMHTMGPRSYAMLRHKLQQEDPEHKEPSQAKVYMESRKRNPKRKYKTSFELTTENIAQMEALGAQAREEGSNSTDPYYKVIEKPEHSGRVRLYGQGVTKSDLKKKGKKSGCIYLQEFVQTMQTELIERLQEANPGINFVIPECFGGYMSSDASKAKSQYGNSNGGQSSVSTHSGNKVQGERIGSNDGACADDQLMEE